MSKLKNTYQFDKSGHFRKSIFIDDIPIEHGSAKTPEMKKDESQRRIIRRIMENTIKGGIISKEEIIKALVSNKYIAEHFSYYTEAGQDLKEIFGNWYDSIKNRLEQKKGNEEEGIEIE